MANEATVFSMTTADGATIKQSEVDVGQIAVATANANAVPASIDVGLYFLKAAYEGNDGRNKLLKHLELIKARIIKGSAAGAWPAI